MSASYNEHLLELGIEYDVGINDGTILKKVRFVGTKQHYGKPIMCFKTENEETVTVNPSYNSFCIEQDPFAESHRIKNEEGENDG